MAFIPSISNNPVRCASTCVDETLASVVVGSISYDIATRFTDGLVGFHLFGISADWTLASNACPACAVGRDLGVHQLYQETYGGLDVSSVSPACQALSVSTIWKRRFHIRNEAKSLEERFREHATRWRKQTDGFSLARKKANHPDYQAIIDLKWEAVPLVLKELRDRGGHWFWALSAMTGDNPIPREAAGNVSEMRECWLRWGRDRKLI